MKIRMFKDSDWDYVKEIYEQGIATGQATFETSAPSLEKWKSSIAEGLCFVVENDKEILGWCKVSNVSSRCVYKGVGEVSVYIQNDAKGKGLGKLLLNHLITESEAKEFWTLTASIFPENTASIHLHKKAGFHELGVRKRIAKQNNIWRDVVLLERRSNVVGID